MDNPRSKTSQTPRAVTEHPSWECKHDTKEFRSNEFVLVILNECTRAEYVIEAEWRIYASVNKAIIGSDNDLSPGRRQAII